MQNNQIFLVIILIFSFINPVIAGDGGAEWEPVVDTVEGLINGSGGRIIAILSLGFALIASIFKFNPAAIAGAIGIGLVASIGTGAVTSIITAII